MTPLKKRNPPNPHLASARNSANLIFNAFKLRSRNFAYRSCAYDVWNSYRSTNSMFFDNHSSSENVFPVRISHSFLKESLCTRNASPPR